MTVDPSLLAIAGEKVASTGLPIASSLIQAAPTLMAAIPGKQERAYRRMIDADVARLAQGRGGMAEGQRQALQAQAMGQVNAQQRAQLAELARGRGDAGASGLQQQAQGAVMRGAQQAGQQAASNIRAQDLALAEQQRQGLDQRMQNAIQMKMQRSKLAIEGAQGMAKSMQGEGAEGRNTAAGEFDTATQQLQGA